MQNMKNQITPHMKILLAVEPVDFRKGIDGMAALCRTVLKADPFTGCLFVFLNRSKTSIKIISYDGQGFWLCQKRLSKGRFNWWPTKGQGVYIKSMADAIITLGQALDNKATSIKRLLQCCLAQKQRKKMRS